MNAIPPTTLKVTPAKGLIKKVLWALISSDERPDGTDALSAA